MPDDLGAKLQETRDRYVVIKHLRGKGQYPDELAPQTADSQTTSPVPSIQSIDEVVEIAKGVPVLKREYDVLAEICAQYGSTPKEEYFQEHKINGMTSKFANVIIREGHIISLSLEKKGISYIPDSIDCLSNLDYLSLRGNSLESLPDSIGNLTSLTYIYLDKNNLTLIPDSIQHLINLEVLNVSDNPLRYLPSLRGLPAFKTLYVMGTLLRKKDVECDENVLVIPTLLDSFDAGTDLKKDY